jgi:uncharacterized LabA/DUF88 family protein
VSAVWWLVDMGYVVKASEGSFRLDYAATQAWLTEQIGPARSILFNSYSPERGLEPAMKQFYDRMKSQHGMSVRLQPLGLDRYGGTKQRRVDVDLATQMVWLATDEETETFVLTTGDQDFVPAVRLVREECDIWVTLLTYDRHVSEELSAEVDEHWLFEDHQSRLEL